MSSKSLVTRSISNNNLAKNCINNPRSNLIVAFTAELKFKCNICKEQGEELVCLCNKCKNYLHPSCAGVETGTVYSTDGKKQVVLPASEKLPTCCPDCLSEPNDKFMMINQLCVQQRSVVVSPSSSSSGITSFLEWGMGPAHKLIEGDSFWMVHNNIPGHQLKLKQLSTNYNCSGCKIEGFGLHYACKNPSCSFILHTECMSPRKTTTHWFFPNVTFVFSCLQSTSYIKHGKKAHTYIFCNACGLDVKGYFYHSLDGKIDLHPCCIKLPKTTICCETQKEMVLQQKSTSECFYCHGKKIKVDNGLKNHAWSYVAVRKSENISLHIACLIRMLTEHTERDSMGRLISCEMFCENGVGKMNMKLALHNAKVQCEKKFKTFMKYAKIALGAIIAALLGDATTLIVSTSEAIASK